MTQWLVAGAVAAGLIFSGSGAAQAQQYCAPRDSLVGNLTKQYDEAPAARGLSGTGNLVELLVGPGGSWTILITQPSGRSCVIGVGEAWHDVPPVPAKLTGEIG